MADINVENHGSLFLLRPGTDQGKEWLEEENAMDDMIHKFEDRGLGKAPFAVIGVEERRGPIRLADGTECGAPGQPMGTCDYCGTGIAICCIIRDSQGKTFIVGSDCVLKTGDEGLKRVIKNQVNNLQREKKHAREGKKVEDAKALYAAEPRIRETLSTYPHPFHSLAEKGFTKADYIDWMLENAGWSGVCRAAYAIQKTWEDINTHYTTATQEAK